MGRVAAFLQLIRWKNILIVLATQLVTWYALLEPLLTKAGYHTVLSTGDILLLLLATISITASGYVINDITDRKTDRINKKKAPLTTHFSVIQGKFIYYSLLSIGIFAGEWLGIRIGNWQYGLLFILVALLLKLYSQKLKGTPLIGNVLVAILSAMVLMIIWFFEMIPQLNIAQLFDNNTQGLIEISYWVFIYAGFSFLITLLREVVKDMEDVKGDDACNLQTFPVKYGLKSAHVLYFILNIITIAFTYWVQTLAHAQGASALYYIGYIIIASLIGIAIVVNKSNFHTASTLLKIVMILGLSTMILIPIFYA